MTSDKLNRFWLLATLSLIIIIITASLIIWLSQDEGRPIQIYNEPSPLLRGEIYIDGAISNPGAYTLKDGDTIDGILQASGGAEKNADLSRLHLYIPKVGDGEQPQKIDINKAEAWLLQALPGIGQVKSQAIIDYRRQNGAFHNIEEIREVPGISDAVFEKIKDFITVAE
jgi:competence protein ComEA